MRIGIVNDSSIAVEALRRTLAQRPGFDVAWVAHDGAQAVSMCTPTPPDLVLMDLVMPVMDGVAATREIMRRSPCPILIVTSDVGHHASLVFDAMGAGALDAVDTPVLGGTDRARPASSLLAKIEAIAAQQADARLPQPSAAPPRAPARTDMLVAIGASAGGPAALAALLGRLPVNFGAGVVVVQHVDEAFAPGMADWLDQQTPLTVRLARAGERPSAGVVLLAGGNRHLRMDASGRCAFTDDPTDAVYRPSIDVFLQSVAENWRARGGRAAHGHGPRRRGRARRHARAGLYHDCAGSRDECGVWHAQSGGRGRCGVADSAAGEHCAATGDAIWNGMTGRKT